MGWITNQPYTAAMGPLEEAVVTGTISALSTCLFMYWTARAMILRAPQEKLDKILDQDRAMAHRAWLAVRIIFSPPALLSI